MKEDTRNWKSCDACTFFPAKFYTDLMFVKV